LSFLERLKSPDSVISVELRPPRAELAAAEGMDAWIDIYHAIKSLSRQHVPVMITDSAVGEQEENNLRHLVANLGAPVARASVVPFLTCKHSLEFCQGYADQAQHHGFESLVVLGGDKHLGRARCVEHAWQLRKQIRARHPSLELGGWANPSANAAQQVDFLLDSEVSADFYLTQIVSHHQAQEVGAFLDEARRRGVTMPGVFGVFYYRSPNPKTLAVLSEFLPVPIAALSAEFAAGATPADVCARTIRTLLDLGARHFYISNLPLRATATTLNTILERAALPGTRFQVPGTSRGFLADFRGFCIDRRASMNPLD
jgi:5,10-methylenetetrahydrofolate reductase